MPNPSPIPSEREELDRLFKEGWGEKCREYEPDCPACKAWKYYEYLKDSLGEIVTDLIMAEKRNHETAIRLKLHEEIRAIHMSHEWNETSEDLKDWLIKDTHYLAKLQQSKETS